MIYRCLRKFILITFMVCTFYASDVDSSSAKKYVVDEEHAEERIRSNDQVQKERIFIGYLAGTSLIHSTNADYSRTIITSPSLSSASKSESSDSRLYHKLSYNSRRRKRRRTVRIFRNPFPNAATANRKSETCNDDETFISLPLEEQAKCMKIRPSTLNLQGQLISGALRYAVEKINADDNLLPNHTLEYKFIDTRGISHLSVKAFMELWGKGATAFIGPEDSCQTEAMMAAAQNLPMVSFKCFDHTVSDKRKYPTFARTAPAESEISKAVISVLKHYKWMHFSIVHGNNDVNKNLLEAIKGDAKLENMKILNVTDYPIPFIVNEDETNDGTNGAERIRQIVAETHKKTRIYLFFGNLNAMRHMLYEMDNQNLFKDGKSEYMVIYVDPAFTFFSADDASINQIYRASDVSIEDFRLPEFYRIVGLSKSLMLIIPTPVQFNRPDYNKFINDIAQYITAPPFEFFKSGIIALAKQSYQLRFNRYASYLYDAVYLYARGLHEVLLEGGSPLNGAAIISKVLNRQYQSMQGFKMKIDENGDAHGNYTLLTRQSLSSSQFNLSHGMIQTGYFVQTNDSIPALQIIDKITVDWATPDGQIPKDMPDCGFDYEKCLKEKDYVTEIVCGVLAGIVLICAIIGFSMYRNRKYEQELAGLIWKIDAKEICFHPSIGMSNLAGSRMSMGSHDSGDGGENIWPLNPTGLAMYKGSLVAIKNIIYPRKVREITRATKIEMKNMRSLHHDNINSFMGIIVESNCIRVVREYCAKGSLFDVLLNENLKLDQLFIASFVEDLLKGMIYLHDSELKVHGNLKSTNCVVSSRWSLQVSDFGLHELRDGQEYESEDSQFYNLLWVSPELLRDDALIHPPKGAQKGDIYSFAIILHEILSRKGPYDIYREDNDWSAKDIVLSVASESSLFRPSLAELDLQGYMIETLESCWDEMPQRRPDFRFIRQRLKPLFKGIVKRNIMDHMITMMEKYQSHLEELVDERTEELKEEKKRTEILLHRMLPKSIASQLITGDDVLPESYDSVTIYFSDIVGFTSLSADSTPMEVVQFLNALYTLFDRIIRQCDVYKVETIGDAYMVVSGLPIRNGDKHSGEIATMALQLLEKVKEFQIPHRKDQPCLLRIGIHTGSCVAGVVGRTMPRYCLFGDTVNTASRMESNGLPLKIHISESTHEALEKLGGYICEERGLVSMKGKGEVRTFWLLGKEEMTPLSSIDVPSPMEDSLFPAPPVKPALRHRVKGSIVAEQSLSSNPTMQSNESLSAVVCRSPKIKPDQPALVQNSTGSKLLQSVPHLVHQRSIAAPGYYPSGPNMRRTSRLLSPPSAAAAAEIMRSRELTKNSGKRASEIPIGSYFDGGKSDAENRLRKRSMSFPENVAALAELVAMTLGSKNDSAPNVKTNASSSDPKLTSNGSLQKDPRLSIELPPSKLLDLSNFRPSAVVDRQPMSTDVAPSLVDVGDYFDPPPKYSSVLLQPDAIASTAPARKRSMSCGDAHKSNVLSIKQSPLLVDSGNYTSEGNPAVFLSSNNNGVQYFSTKSAHSDPPTSNTDGVGDQCELFIDRERDSNNQEEEDFVAESPLLFDSNRFKRQRKSAGSLVVSTPKPNHWYPNGGEAGGIGGGSLPKLNRLLRYFKRPASEDLHDFEPEPSLV